MSNPTISTDVIIVGGGPVGLYLGGRLLQQGIRCKILEKRNEADIHSKSLGIHPLSLELFQNAGIAEMMMEEGLKIKKGVAFWNRKLAGEITFETCPKPFRFILSLPQWKTEKLLENWVISLDRDAIIRGAEVTQLTQNDDRVLVSFKKDDQKLTLRAAYAVGCDGKNSTLRNLLEISFNGKPYPDTYIMGDFVDNTDFGTNAAVYLHQEGLIESFPLPNGLRRWVVKTDQFISEPDPVILARLVYQRLGHRLDENCNEMISSFGVQHYLAESFHQKRTLLAGDAAHVVSPIGGQGMNLGWLGAEKCCNALIQKLQPGGKSQHIFENYTLDHTKIARQVARRAEINMWLGRSENSGFAVKVLVKLMLTRPLSNILARLFTMRGLGSWLI